MNNPNENGDARTSLVAARVVAFVLVGVMGCFFVQFLAAAFDWALLEWSLASTVSPSPPSVFARCGVAVATAIAEVAMLVAVIHCFALGRYRRATVGTTLLLLGLAIASFAARLGTSGLFYWMTSRLVTHHGVSTLAQWTRDAAVVNVLATVLNSSVPLVALTYALWRWHAATQEQARTDAGPRPLSG